MTRADVSTRLYHMLLLDLFVSQNKLTELEAKDIESDISVRDDVLVDDLLKAKNITGDDIMQVRSVLYGLPIYSKEIPEDKELTRLINVTQSKQLLAVPLEMVDNVLSVGVVDPEHGNVLDSLQFLFGTDHQAYKVYLITYDAYKKHFGLATDAPLEKASLTDKVAEEKLSYVSKDDGEQARRSREIDLSEVSQVLDADLANLPFLKFSASSCAMQLIMARPISISNI
jgi:hypothetical protein